MHRLSLKLAILLPPLSLIFWLLVYSPGFFGGLFMILFFTRFYRTIVNAISFWTFRAYPVLEMPKFLPSNATVIIPSTLSNPSQIIICIQSILACSPSRLILVVGAAKLAEAAKIRRDHGLENVEILSVPKLGKRVQLVRGLREVDTPVTIFADDDVIWPSNYLSHLLAPLENSDIGACGTNQRVIRKNGFDILNFLGIAYLERRNFNTGSTCHIDGGVSTLSGRTSCYRTDILQNEEFYHRFQNATWMGHVLDSDDDKFLTKWVYSHGWKIHLQITEETVLYTTTDSGLKFLHQCLRWARAHWRGNIDVVCNESYWYKTHWWTLYATYIGSLMTPSVVVDCTLLYFLHKAILENDISDKFYRKAMCVFFLWLLFTKTVKLLSHFRRYPQDIIYLPISILFAFFHGFLNLYAFFTMHVTTWGNK